MEISNQIKDSVRNIVGILGLLVLLAWTPPAVRSEDFQITPAQIEISVAPGFDHVPIRLSVVNAAFGFDIAQLEVESDAAWVAPAVDVANSAIVLNFSTAALINRTYAATVRARHEDNERTASVTATVAPLEVAALMDDPVRQRVYGIQQDAEERGSALVVNSLSGRTEWNISVGRRPADMAISSEGDKLYVINAGDASISVVDLNGLFVYETLPLASFNKDYPTARIDLGPGGLIYYTDGAEKPQLRALDRETLQVLRTYSVDPGSNYGFGDFVVTRDRRNLLGWAFSQHWDRSYVTRFSIDDEGGLHYEEMYPPGGAGTLLLQSTDSPALASEDGLIVFIKDLAFRADDLQAPLRSFPEVVYSISPGGEVAATRDGLYETKNGIRLLDLPTQTSVQAISSDYSRLVYFDPQLHELKALDLLESIGPEVMGREPQPPEGAVVQSPDLLIWSPLPGVEEYHVYLGASESEVLEADADSSLFLGTSNTARFALAESLPPGQYYYWRVDGVTPVSVIKGGAHSFFVSTIASSARAMEAATLQGHASLRRQLDLTSEPAGRQWKARTNVDWLTFAADSGTTPATLEVNLNAVELEAGVHTARIEIRNGADELLFELPVTLNVGRVQLTRLVSDPETVFAYGINANTLSALPEAYLVEINTLTESISRVVDAGGFAADLALHAAENRIYAAHWEDGVLRAFDLDSLAPVQEYPFALPSSNNGDVRRIAAGTEGRLVVMGESRWSDVFLIDTATGATLATSPADAGGGRFDPTGRFYYHGENQYGDRLYKFDLTGDRFTELASADINVLSSKGTPIISISEDGGRIFWNGGVFDSSLQLEWEIKDHVFAASTDGRFAFSETKIYDVENRKVHGDMPAQTRVSAYNSLTDKLICHDDGTLLFQRFFPEELHAPAHGAIVTSPQRLEWPEIGPVHSYRVYLGESESEVVEADTDSPDYLGTFFNGFVELGRTLNAGQTYYWRVDQLTDFGTIPGAVRRFTVSNVSVDPSVISVSTTQHATSSFTIRLDAEASGTPWQISTDAPWIRFSASEGTAPESVSLYFDASGLNAGGHQSTVELTSGGSAVSVPVSMTVRVLEVLFIQSDPGSERAFAVGNVLLPQPSDPKNLLLRIDTAAEVVESVVELDVQATDLEVHAKENRVYVASWQASKLLAFNMDTMALEQTYDFEPPGASREIYRISGGHQGRLIVEGHPFRDVTLIDTATGDRLDYLASIGGNGAYAPDGRYYYRVTGEHLYKYDLAGDQFTQVGRVDVKVQYNSDFAHPIVVSGDGMRILYFGKVFNPYLEVEWVNGEEVYAASHDGRYIFSDDFIYNVDQQGVFLGMPPSVRHAYGYNSATSKLIIQENEILKYYSLSDSPQLTAPEPSLDFIGESSVRLRWTDANLETGYTLQMRIAGTASWVEAARPNSNETEHTVANLQPKTAYEFRIRADIPSGSSDWSSVVAADIPGALPSTPQLHAPAGFSFQVKLAWSDSIYEEGYAIERTLGDSENWQTLALVEENVPEFIDDFVQGETIYRYRIKAFNSEGDSGYSNVRTVSLPAAAPPSVPADLNATPIGPGRIEITWTSVANEAGYYLERSDDHRLSWFRLAALPTDQTQYVDEDVIQGLEYWYRVRAYNPHGESGPSNENNAVADDLICAAADDFDPVRDASIWADVTGGAGVSGDGGLLTGAALMFEGAGVRQAATIEVDVQPGGFLEFDLRAGNEQADGERWDNSEPGNEIWLEYSTNNGGSWHLLAEVDTVFPALSNWVDFTFKLPAAACSRVSQFRWRQPLHDGEGLDVWALDNVCVRTVTPLVPGAPRFILASANSSNSVAVLWLGGWGAEEYRIERSVNGQPWSLIGVTSAANEFFTDDSVAPGNLYAYRVKSVDGGRESAYSDIAYVEVKAQSSGLDFGDLPDLSLWDGLSSQEGLNYATRLSEDGPRHEIVPGLQIGMTAPDGELDGQPRLDALGDDGAGAAPDDEEGVVLPDEMYAGDPATFYVKAINLTDSPAFLYGFIDWDGDGGFDGDKESLPSPVIVPTGEFGSNFYSLSFDIPYNARTDRLIGARFRFSATPGLTASGPAMNGEVEDYLIRVSAKPIEPLWIRIDDISALPGALAEIPARVSGFQDINGIQLTLRWDPSIATLDPDEPLAQIAAIETAPGVFEPIFNNENIHLAEPGVLALEWDEAAIPATGRSFDDGVALFALRMRIGPEAQNGESTLIEVGNVPTPYKATNAAGRDVEEHWESGTLTARDQARISGLFKYFGDPAALVPNVELDLLIDDQPSVQAAGSDGRFQVDAALGRDVELTPFYNDWDNASRGVDVEDIIVMRKAILGLAPLAGYHLIAGDVNRSQSVDVQDIVQIRKVILSRQNYFSESEAETAHPVWRFFVEEMDLALSEDPFSELGTLGEHERRMFDAIDADHGAVNFTAVKLGDANGDWNAGASAQSGLVRRDGAVRLSSLDPASSADITIENVEADGGTPLVVPIRLGGVDSLVGVQCGFVWDRSLLEFHGAESELLTGFDDRIHAETSDGKFKLLWDDPTLKGVDATRTNELLRLKFRITSPARLPAAIRSDPSGISPVIVTKDGRIELYAIQSGTVRLASAKPDVTVIGVDDLQLQINRLGESGISISFMTTAGRRYVLERSEALSSAQWTAVETIDGGDGVKEVSHYASDKSRRFYRLRIVPIY